MLRQFFKTTSQILGATAVFLLILEGGFRLAGEPTGTSRFAERIIFQEHLRPKKSPVEFRIFTFGESTMHGTHYAPVSNPARWLEKYLRDFLPEKNIRVINFARMGRGSYFTYETFRDTLPYKPDLAIFYLGHNIFLNKNRRAEIESENKTLHRRLRRLQRRSAFASAIYRWSLRSRIAHHKDKPEDQIGLSTIEAPPMGYGPDTLSPRNSRVYRDNIEFFKENISQILELANKKGIPALFLKPVCNLKDFAPNHSTHLKDLSAQDLSRWQQFYEEGRKKEREGNFDEAQRNYLQAETIDNTYADLSFRLGQIEFRKGELEKARKHFEAARDNDDIVFRVTQDTLEVFEELARTKNLQLIDTEKILQPKAPGGILGEPIIEDNVHFSIEGHAWVARALADEIARRNWIAPHEKWQFQRERSYEEISRELGINPELLFSAYLKMVHYFGSHFENRIRYAQKALAIHPQDPRAMRHLAWAYWMAGEKAKALEIYQELERVNPESFFEILENLKKFSKASQDYGASRLMDDLGGTGKGTFIGRPK